MTQARTKWFPIAAVVLTLLVASIGAVLRAQTLPPKRAHHSLVYDAAARRVLLLGGSTPINDGNSFKFFDDVWSFDGRAWTLVGATGNARSGLTVAFDTKRGRLLSLGGYCGCKDVPEGRFSDLLALDGAKWKPLAGLDGHPITDGAMVYDEKRDRMVLFGGSGLNRQNYGDTREFDGVQWTPGPADGPGKRSAMMVAYDSKRGRTVLFGGSDPEQGGRAGDTWEYDGVAWTKRATSGPSPRLGGGAAYDARRGRMIIFGGIDASGVIGDTWAWDGTTWTKLADDGPPKRIMGMLAYDAQRDRVVMFGGRAGWPNDLNDTWEWDGTRWQEIK